jgi:CRP-like cAMP-binding protein
MNMEKQAIADALADQELVGQNKDAAKILAANASRRILKKGAILFSPTHEKHEKLYFILSGKIGLFIGKRHLASARHQECLGEFPLLDPKFQKNQVTATSEEDTVIVEIEYQDFKHAADLYPELWRRMARMLANRLEQRNKEDKFLDEIERYETIASGWLRNSRRLSVIHYVIGSLALILSVLVASKSLPGISGTVLAWVASCMTGLISFWSLRIKVSNSRDAWVKLNTALAKARATPGTIIDDIVKAHGEAEAILKSHRN